jgi:gliding motility associated protien GldN
MNKYKIFIPLYFLSISFTNNVFGQFRQNNEQPPIERNTSITTPQVLQTQTSPTLRALDTVVRKVDTTIIVGYNSKNQNSLRSNNAFDQIGSSKSRKFQDRIELPYQSIREEDVLYSVFVWEEIDAREKINRPFIYTAYDDNGDQRFFAILLKALDLKKEDGITPMVTPFSADGGDDRFTKPMSTDELNALLKGKLDTTEIDDGGGRSHLQEFYNTSLAVKPDSVYNFLIKEQFIFDRRTSRMYCRIIGIAPIATFKYQLDIGNGRKEEKISKNVLFWLYYPELRSVLAKYEVYNPKNVSNRITWEELFESRYFNGNIVKSSLDNFTNKRLDEIFKDPIKRLQEGEKIKQKIFDFEQDRWVY